MGIFSRSRSHVIRQIPPEKSRVPRSSTELSTRHRSFDAGNQLAEEGLYFAWLQIPRSC